MMDYHRQYRVDIRIVRIFNTYGPKMALNDGRVVSNFILQALQGKEITVYGDGSQTRSFCYVDDLIDGMIRMMNATGVTGPINLGNPGEFSVLELAEKVIALTGSRSKIVFKPLPADDPTQRKPDISLADRALSWEPKIALEEGLKKTIDYFDHQFSSVKGMGANLFASPLRAKQATNGSRKAARSQAIG
jgi:UDP-glucuronate decarboxylase